MSKKIVLILFLLGNVYSSFAQLKVFAGNDTSYCGYLPNNLILGERVKVENAVEPIKVAWECMVDIGLSYDFFASDFLNDTTVLSPYFIDFLTSPTWIAFIIHVTDKDGNYASDTLRVRFSIFTYLLDEYYINIHQGDSIQLYGISNIGGGISPLEIALTPSYGLSDSTDLNTWAKPEFSTNYYLIATDSIGCVSSPQFIYSINIFPTKVEEYTKSNSIKQIGSKIVFENKDSEKCTLSVYTVNGTLLVKEETTKNYFEIGSRLPLNGIYLCIISINQKHYSLQFLKKQHDEY